MKYRQQSDTLALTAISYVASEARGEDRRLSVLDRKGLSLSLQTKKQLRYIVSPPQASKNFTPSCCEGLGFIPVNRKFICRVELQSYQILQKALEIEEMLPSRLQQNSKILQTAFVAFISSFRVNFPHCTV